MKFLLPTGGQHDGRFHGILTTPSHKGVLAGIKDGTPWAADNEAFTKGWDPERFFSWLETMRPYRDTCLFVTVPDVVSDAAQTAVMWRVWSQQFAGWPLAFVAQDGAEANGLGLWNNVEDPDDETELLDDDSDDGWWDAYSQSRGRLDWQEFDALFVGGSTEWKEGETAVACIKAAQRAGKHVHIGRVNWHRRYKLFAMIAGSDAFTCDGTRPRYEGIERTKEAWAGYQQTTMLPLF